MTRVAAETSALERAPSGAKQVRDPRDTPAMRQFYSFKKQHPECVLLFRIGDFYETFDDDAVKLSRALGLTLTQRTEGVPMAGVPYHQLENYLRKAIAAGFRVAVCDQLQDAKDAKGIVDRGVTRVVTPGTRVDESLLSADGVATLGAVYFPEAGDDSSAAIAVADLSTGSFVVMECAGGGRGSAIADELSRLGVSELLFAETADGKAPPRLKAVLDALAALGQPAAPSPQPPWHFRRDEALESLLTHYGVRSLEGFGLDAGEAVVRPAGALVRYLVQTQMPDASGAGGRGQDSKGNGRASRSLAHLLPPRRELRGDRCIIDGATLRSLEVLRTMRAPDATADGGGIEDRSLYGVFQSGGAGDERVGCRTAAGKRLMREWLCAPLCERAAITARQDAVSLLVEDRRLAGALGGALERIQDVVRISGRVALRRATPRDVVALGRSLSQAAEIGSLIEGAPVLRGYHARLAETQSGVAPVAASIGRWCVDSPPAHLREGGLIRDGVDAMLDEARLLQKDASAWLAQYQARLIAAHDLPSLKVGFTKIFGYYIELPSAQAKRAPEVFRRQQTLKNAERYTTPELKEFEEKVLHAEARAIDREAAIFDQLMDEAASRIPSIHEFGRIASELDVLVCFADKAVKRRWSRPLMVDEPVLSIRQGRHPVLDEVLNNSFVPNDVSLGIHEGETGDDVAAGDRAPSPRLALITGPNMAGKSTFIRQTALLTLLAHTGSFVPAEGAIIGITDRIFTRVGADDALHSGQSTFMVEMTETARILNHATARSLVVLDEIGRGTSTLDGLSLAWAVAESLAGDPASAPRTLFATHYHEITRLQEELPGRVANLHVSVREWGDSIVFLHRILAGQTDRSYGIHVAKLAGVPAATIRRAQQILDSLAVEHAPGGEGWKGGPGPRGVSVSGKPGKDRAGQMSLFTEYLEHPVLAEIRSLKIDGMTPLQAFDALRKLNERAREGLTDNM